jgi:hypothetical protein
MRDDGTTGLCGGACCLDMHAEEARAGAATLHEQDDTDI